MENTSVIEASVDVPQNLNSVDANLAPEISVSSPIQDNILTFQSLDETNRDRYYTLVSCYSPDKSLEIIGYLTQYGLNTWSSVRDKVEFIMDKLMQTDYYAAISNLIETDKFYSIEEIIQNISTLRRRLSLPAYKSNIAKQCAKDFLQTHIGSAMMTKFNDVKTGKPYIAGYTSVFIWIANYNRAL